MPAKFEAVLIFCKALARSSVGSILSSLAIFEAMFSNTQVCLECRVVEKSDFLQKNQINLICFWFKSNKS